MASEHHADNIRDGAGGDSSAEESDDSSIEPAPLDLQLEECRLSCSTCSEAAVVAGDSGKNP